MRTRRFRLWLVFFVALFALNSVAAAARACAALLAGQQHCALRASADGVDESTCPAADAAPPCSAHCAQEARSPQQKVAADVPAPVFAPSHAVVRIAHRPEAAMVQIAAARPIFGPPLTILFGKLRN